MAIWQYRLILLPERILLGKYEVLPASISMELAEDFNWWSEIQPQAGLEHQIDRILPAMESWSESMRMWGQKHGDDAYVCYVDEKKEVVEEISFRIDARSLSLEFVRRFCALAEDLGCVLMTSDYEILAPEEEMVLNAVKHSAATKFLNDPASTLEDAHKKIQAREDRRMRKTGDERGQKD
jgi:hypothetical protein